VERGGLVDKSLVTILRLRGLVTGGNASGEPLLFEGQPGRTVGLQEIRVSYCACRLQTVEPVAGHAGEWVPVARRTVELEMGHKSGEMVERVYGRVQLGRMYRLTAVAYPGLEGWSP
jgi:hypothetical protein